MASSTGIRDQILTALRDFYGDTDLGDLNDDDDMIAELGCTSLEGVDFACELSDALRFDLPHDFNPFIHESGKRGRTLGEMVAAIATTVRMEAHHENLR